MLLKKNLFLCVVFMMLCLVLSTAHLFSYAFNPYTSMLEPKTLAINPYLYTSGLDPLGLNTDLLVQYAINAKWDLYVNFATLQLAPDFDYDSSYIMGRYSLSESHIVGLQFGNEDFGPQYHFYKESDHFAFCFNTALFLPYSDMGEFTLQFIIAPVYKFSDNLAIYLEGDPYYTEVDGNVYVDILPGIYFAFGKHAFNFAVILNDVTNGSDVNLGLWYFTTFQL